MLEDHPTEDESAQPLLEFTELVGNPHYTLLLYAGLLDQFRILLTDKRQPDPTAPTGHGEIVQELCTYRGDRAGMILAQLRYAPDPLSLARSWAHAGNCEYPGDRIRLDSPANLQPATLQPA